MTTDYGREVIDPRYFNVSVECIDFAPILFEDAVKAIQDQGGHVGFKERTRAVDTAM